MKNQSNIDSVIGSLDVKEVFVKSTNYLQYIDTKDSFKEVQYDYQEKRFYEFKSVGRSDRPKEIFVKFIN